MSFDAASLPRFSSLISKLLSCSGEVAVIVVVYMCYLLLDVQAQNLITTLLHLFQEYQMCPFTPQK